MKARAKLLAASVLLASAIAGAWSFLHAEPRAVLSPLRPLGTPRAISVAVRPAPPASHASDAARSERPENETEAEPRRPHPITPAHVRIFRENNLIGRLNSAMDLGDFGELRRLNQQYRSQYPEDAHELQEPYALIADCQEQRSAPARERAQRYWSEHRSSTLRRYLRRYCLENES